MRCFFSILTDKGSKGGRFNIPLLYCYCFMPHTIINDDVVRARDDVVRARDDAVPVRDDVVRARDDAVPEEAEPDDADVAPVRMPTACTCTRLL